MSGIRIQCHGCSQELSLPDSAVGKRAKCPQCKTIFEVNAQPESPILASSVPTNPYRSPVGDSNDSSGSLSHPSKTASQYDDKNPPPLGLITVPLYISAMLYLLLGVGALALLVVVPVNGNNVPLFLSGLWVFFALFCLALAGFIFFFTGQIRKRKKWAWITAIAFGGLYTPSAFIFLGVPILIGGLKPEVQAWFNTD